MSSEFCNEVEGSEFQDRWRLCQYLHELLEQKHQNPNRINNELFD